METEFSLRDLDAQPVLGIRARCRRSALEATLEDILPACRSYAEQRDAQPARDSYLRLFEVGPDEIELEGGCAIGQPVAGASRVVRADLPGGKVACAFHTGPLDELGETRTSLEAWARDAGFEPAGEPWERFHALAATEHDPAARVIELILPVRPVATPRREAG